tara:strand:- start:27829 stop:28470 length:642 start_codon:yes stop_codon:yes gene_type:complete
MKITVYSLKGSAGKTPIAMNIALDREYALATNETQNILGAILPEEQLLGLRPNEEFPKFPDEIDVVFDLAGHISEFARPSIVSAVSQSDVVLVPIYNELKSLYAGGFTINELLPYNKNIVVVATKIERGKAEMFKDWRDSADVQNIMRVVKELTGREFPVAPLKKSKVFDTIFEKERSIRQLREEEPLAMYTYREVGEQFESLMTMLEANYGK